MKDDPPRIVVSMNAGEIPRYSAKDKPEVRLCALAHSSPSKSLTRSPQSANAPWSPRPSGGLYRPEDRVGRLVAAGAMDAELDPHADLDGLGGDVLDPAHQPEAFVAINEGHIVGCPLARVGDGRRVRRAEPGDGPPFEPIAAAKGTDHTRVEHHLLRLGAPLVGQLALFEVRLIDRQG